MTVIDGVFCLRRACEKQTRDTFRRAITLDWGAIVGGYKHCRVDTVMRDRI